MDGFLSSGIKERCFGCESCVQACSQNALEMVEDEEGFKYPMLDENKCIHCNVCNKVCPYEETPEKYGEKKYVFGGYIKDENIRFNSTSGGAFSAIVDTNCDENYVIFGAESKGMVVRHSFIKDKGDIY